MWKIARPAFGLLAMSLALASTVSASPNDVSAILRSVSSDRSSDPDLAVAKLVRMGPGAVPSLIAASERCREPEQLEVMVSAIRRLDPSRLDEFLLAFVAGPGQDRGRNAAYSTLGAEGSAESIPRLIEIMDANHPRMKRPAELALVRLLVRHDDPGIYRTVEEAVKRSNPETLARVLCRVGETDSLHALRLLIRHLGRSDGLDFVVVTAMALLPKAGGSSEAIPKLREVLTTANPCIRKEAITALALYGDVDSVGRFIDGLEDKHSGIQGNSIWALKTMSGLEFPPEPKRWRLWYREEMEWWEAEGRDLLAVLETGNPKQIMEAIRVLTDHRLFRSRYEPLLLALREHEEYDVRAAADKALLDLGLTTGRSVRDVGAALVARGFHPISRDQLKKPTAAPPREPAGRSGSSKLVPIVGMAAILVLLLRLFGPALVHFWSSGKPREGPMTLTISRDKRG